MSEVIKDSAIKLSTSRPVSPPRKAVYDVSLSQNTTSISQDRQDGKSTSSEISDDQKADKTMLCPGCENNKNGLVPERGHPLSYYPMYCGCVLGKKNLRADGERSVKLRIDDESGKSRLNARGVFDERTAVLRANPAALCRSFHFHETI